MSCLLLINIVIIICIYWFEQFSQVSVVAHVPLVEIECRICKTQCILILCKYSPYLEFDQWLTLTINKSIVMMFSCFATTDNNKTNNKCQRLIQEVNQTAWFSQLLFPVVYCVEFSDGTSLHLTLHVYLLTKFRDGLFIKKKIEYIIHPKLHSSYTFNITNVVNGKQSSVAYKRWVLFQCSDFIQITLAE